MSNVSLKEISELYSQLGIDIKGNCKQNFLQNSISNKLQSTMPTAFKPSKVAFSSNTSK